VAKLVAPGAISAAQVAEFWYDLEQPWIFGLLLASLALGLVVIRMSFHHGLVGYALILMLPAIGIVLTVWGRHRWWVPDSS
jgi:hypothetical protein